MVTGRLECLWSRYGVDTFLRRLCLKQNVSQDVSTVVFKAAFTSGNMLPREHVAGDKQHVAGNKIVASLLPSVAGYKGIHVAEIQATCCRHYVAGNKQTVGSVFMKDSVRFRSAI